MGSIIKAISTNNPAWIKKLTAGLSHAISTPPRPGPTTRATFPAMAFKAMAFQRSWRGTVLATIACRTGWIRVCNTPVMHVNSMAYTMPSLPVTYPACMPMAKANTTTASADCTTRTSLRRSTRSARTPARGPMKRNGKDRIPPATPTQKGECEICQTTQGTVIC